VLKRVRVTHWGWYIECAGTQEQLIAAGVASIEMFEDFGKSRRQRASEGEFGDEITVRRRPKQQWTVELRVHECLLCDPLDEQYRKLKCFRDSVPAAITAVDEILRSMRAPVKRARSRVK